VERAERFRLVRGSVTPPAEAQTIQSADPHPLPPPGPDLQGDIYLSAAQIAARTRELGEEISHDYAGLDLLLVSVLKGALFFVADLARALTVPVEFDFLAISSYGDRRPDPSPPVPPPSPPVRTGARTETPRGIRFLKDLDRPIEGKQVVVVESIVDTGLTLHYILSSLALREPASLAVCTLLDRPYRRLADIPVRYRGFTVPDDFFVGYGFDYRQHYRHLPDIRLLKI